MFDQIDALSGLSMVPEGPVEVRKRFRVGLGNMRENVARLTRALHEDLFDEFGPERFDEDTCAKAYSSLFDLLDISAPFGDVVIATTNYDRSIELCFERYGLELRTGARPHSYRKAYLEPEGLGHFDSTRPSLLYLHGAVGWYTEQGGKILCASAEGGYQPDRGRPTVLYPDPDKEIQRSETAQIWLEFQNGLREATHVLVIGHSLNDRHLLDALANTPSAKIGVLLHESDGSEVKERVRRAVRRPNDVFFLAGGFGSEPRLGGPGQWEKFLTGTVTPLGA